MIEISLQSVLNAHVKRPSLTLGKASMLEIGPSPQFILMNTSSLFLSVSKQALNA
jgi:hypothetical protein